MQELLRNGCLHLHTTLDAQPHNHKEVNVRNLHVNVKFSKGPGAISKHKSEDIEKSMGRIKKTYICFL